MSGPLTEQLDAALRGSQPDAVVRAIETIFRTGSAGACERIAPLLTAGRLAEKGGVPRAQTLLWTLFNRTRHFDDTGPAGAPGWLEALAPVAEPAALFHMAALYLSRFRGARAVDVLLRMLEHLRGVGVGVGGPSYAVIHALVGQGDARAAPAIVALLGAPSADDWTMSHALREMDDPATAAALRAYAPNIRKKKYRAYAMEVVAHLERDRSAG